jgi:hypothetical protein
MRYALTRLRWTCLLNSKPLSAREKDTSSVNTIRVRSVHKLQQEAVCRSVGTSHLRLDASYYVPQRRLTSLTRRKV